MRCLRQIFQVVAAISCLAASCRITLAAQEPIALLDFATGATKNLKVIGDLPPVVTFDGHRLLEMSVGKVSMQMEWPADMPNPGLPGMAETRKKSEIVKPKLVLDIDEHALGLKTPVPLAFVITVYDYCSGYIDTQGTTLEWATGDAKSPRGSGSFLVSGDPFASDLLARPRLIRKTVLAPQVLLQAGQPGGDVGITPAFQVFIQRFEVYPFLAS